jgi:2-dehydropantoate 2-reductase
VKILFLGAGGVGGYFGGRLAEAGAEVSFLVRAGREAQIRANGLVIETPSTRIVIPPERAKTLQREQLTATFDAVFLTCKAWDLASAIESIRPALHAESMVIPLLNGMSHLHTLDDAFGAPRVMGGSSQIGAQLTADGVVRNLSETHNILWGARDGSARQRAVADALAEAFGKTPVNWKVSETVLQDMWEKFVFLCTLAALTAGMRASVGSITATPEGRSLIRRTMDLCIDIATREGYPPRDDIRARYDAVVNSNHSPLTASMLRDVQSGNPVEADHIIGGMLTLARKHGLDATLLAWPYTHLKVYEMQRHQQNAG